MERALARDLAAIFRAVASGAAEDAEAGRHGAALAEIDHYRDRIRGAILARGTATASEFIGLTLEQIEAIGGQAKDLRASRALQVTTDWLKTYAAEQVVDVTASVKRAIRRALSEGDAQGLGNAGIARIIVQKLGGQASQSRAMVIARTETQTAANYGSQEAAEATALVLDKEWAAVGDARTRATHLAADGQTVDIKASFAVGDATLRFPGDPLGSPEEIIQCRCTVLYVPKR